MILQELLEYTARDVLDDRTVLLDGPADELHTAKYLVRLFNEAQRILARRAWVIIDVGHKQAGVITLKEGQASYPLHKSILRVYKATPSDTDIPLGRSTDDRLSFAQAETPDYFDVNFALTRDPGRPVAIATDVGTRRLLVSPAPGIDEAGLKLVLKVARLPICFLEVGKTAESPEVPEEYHMALGDYAAGRSLSKPYADSPLHARGRDLLQGFEMIVREARQERLRAESAPPRFAFASTTALL